MPLTCWLLALALQAAAPASATAAVEGLVLQADGAPVAGAFVSAGGGLETETDESGAFRLEGLPPGPLRLTASAPCCLEAETGLLLRAESRPRRVELRLHPTVTVRGRLLGPPAEPNPAGPKAPPRPLAGAELSVVPEWERHPLDPPLTGAQREAVEELAATSGEDGAFVLEGLPRRARWRLAVRHPGHAPRSVVIEALAPEVETEARLMEGAALMLRAVDEEGRPWPSPVARLFSDDAPDLDLLPELAPGDEEGRLALEHLLPGRYTIELRAAGAQPRVLRGLELANGRTSELGELVLPPGARIAGRVEDEAGAPLEGAEVRLRGWAGGRRLVLEQESGPEGRFAFEGLDLESPSRVDASAEDRLSDREEDVPPNTTELVLRLEPAGRLRARVVDAETGEPVKRYRAVAEGRDDAGRRGRRQADARDGEVEIEGLRPGTYELRIESAAHRPRRLEGLEVVAGVEPEVQRIELDRGWELRGVVLDPEGRGVAGARLDATLPTGSRRSATSEPDGRFLLPGLDGVVTLKAGHERWRDALLPDVAEDAGEIEIRFRLGGAVEGLVLGPDGAPLPGAVVGTGGHHGEARRTRSDAAGRYRLEGLDPGEIVLTKVDRPGSNAGFEQARLTIEAGRTVQHDFGTGRRLEGRVTRGGEPVPQARISLMHVPLVAKEAIRGAPAVGAQLGWRTTSREDGSFALAGLQSGLHGLTVLWRGLEATRSVEIADGASVTRVEVELPERLVTGVVVDAQTNEPLAGAHVALSLVRPERTDGLVPLASTAMTSGEDPDDMLVLKGSPGASGETDAAGRFALASIEEGPHRVFGFLRGYEPKSLEPRPLAELTGGLTLALEPADEAGLGTYLIRVRDAETGEPVRDVHCWIRQQGGASGLEIHGEYRWDQARPGVEGRVELARAGRAPVVLTVPPLEPGETRSVDAELAEGAHLRLLVPPGALTPVPGPFARFDGLSLVDADGLDWGGAQLSWTLQQRAVEDEPGRWLLSHLLPGSYELQLQATGATASFDLVAGQTEELDLR